VIPRWSALALGLPLLAAPVPPPLSDTVRIEVDVAAGRHPISPLIYGVAFADAAALRDLGSPLNRSGGNSASLYNWRADARGAGRDWYFETLPCTADDRACFTGDRLMAATRAAGDGTEAPAAIVTVPMTGWVAQPGQGGTRRAGFSVARYGRQRAVDRYYPDAGDGQRPGGGFVVNDPRDAARPADERFQQAWVAALVRRWGRADRGGVAYYALDNEPSLWFETHRSVRPVGAHASEIAAATIRYAAAVKRADPSARVIAPEEWGWNGYRHSGFDIQWSYAHGYDHAPDRATETGGMDYVPWLLTRWKAAGRPVDVVSLHYYPQGGEYDADHPDVSPAMQARRNRSTRSLWDPSYVDESWIGERIALIPRLRGWVDRYYHRDAPIALTEYSWGAEGSMNGATAQADVLGIFGREGLDMATRWIVPPRGSPVWLAMKLYRNADGRGGGFGEESVAARVPDPDTVAAFAARRRDGALTLVAINKRADRPASIDVGVRTFAATGRVGGYRLARGVLGPLEQTRYSAGRLAATLPPQSVTLFILRR
jgi:hypothetical protein